jgi:hypothetical protein
MGVISQAFYWDCPKAEHERLRGRTDECRLSGLGSGWLATCCYSLHRCAWRISGPHQLQFLERPNSFWYNRK